MEKEKNEYQYQKLHNIPKFLDVHPMKGDKSLKKAVSEPPDEFGVTTENALYNVEADRLYCILNVPDKEAIVNHHKKLGVICEWIMEIKTSA